MANNSRQHGNNVCYPHSVTVIKLVLYSDIHIYAEPLISQFYENCRQSKRILELMAGRKFRAMTTVSYT